MCLQPLFIRFWSHIVLPALLFKFGWSYWKVASFMHHNCVPCSIAKVNVFVVNYYVHICQTRWWSLWKSDGLYFVYGFIIHIYFDNEIIIPWCVKSQHHLVLYLVCHLSWLLVTYSPPNVLFINLAKNLGKSFVRQAFSSV